MANSRKYIIGIDEVGRGPLAGPVMVATVALPLNSKIKIQSRRPSGSGLRPQASEKSKLQFKNKKLILRDSKKLSPRQREIWFKYIKNHPDIFYKTASVSPAVIDRINIARAANLAASRAFLKLISKNFNGSINRTKVFLDGGLYINKPMTNNLKLITKNLKLKTVVKGDEKIPAIMLASIVAKVSRDRKMKKLHFEYPQYDFINNVGYGTKRHRRAIRKHGLSPIHRRSFRIK